MRAASGVKNGAVTVSDADVCCFRCFCSPEGPEDAAGADLSRLLPPLPVRDDDDALLRFRLRWLPFPEAAAAEATALATAVAVGPPCIVIPSSLSSPKKPPDVDRGLVGATIQLCLCCFISGLEVSSRCNQRNKFSELRGLQVRKECCVSREPTICQGPPSSKAPTKRPSIAMYALYLGMLFAIALSLPGQYARNAPQLRLVDGRFWCREAGRDTAVAQARCTR